MLAACVFLVQQRMDVVRRDLPPGYEVLYLPTGKHVKLLSFGYQQLLADVVYLWSIQYTTDPRVPDRFERVEHMYEIINNLDPLYSDPYHIGAMMMAYEMNNVPMALRLLDRGIRNLPQNWNIPMDAGFYAYMQLHDYQRAIRYFDAAMQRPGAPALLRRMKADMYQRQGDIETARDYWHEIYTEATDERTRRIGYNHYFDLSQAVDLRTLRRAIAAYSAAKGHHPSRLARLKEESFLAEIPRNPDGEEYLYNPRTGDVQPPSPFRLNRLIE